MKRLVCSVVWVSIFFAASFAKASQNEECTLEQAINFRTATLLAIADYDATMRNAEASDKDLTSLQADDDYRAAIVAASKVLPDSCLLKLVTADDHIVQCQEPALNAAVKTQPDVKLSNGRYLQTKDRMAYAADMRKVARAALQLVPKVCWFMPLSPPSMDTTQPCPQEWANYNRCHQSNREAIASGGGSINNKNRGSILQCFAPGCLPDGSGNVNPGNGNPPPPPPPDPLCPQKWSEFQSCEREYNKCTAANVRYCSYGCRKPLECPEYIH